MTSGRKNIRLCLMFLSLVLAVVVSILGFYSKVITRKVTLFHDLQNKNLAADSSNCPLIAFHRENKVLTNYSGQGTKYIVYDCSKARKGYCGGWSDRMAGIMTTFIISILTKRHFLINFDTPCLLQDYVTPAHFDWQYNSSILLNRTSSFQYLPDNSLRNKANDMRGDDLNSYFKDDVAFLRMNRDYINYFRNRSNIGNEIPWLTRYHQVDIYKHVFNFLFKPSPVTIRELNNQYKTKRKRKKIACAHVRVGLNPNMPRDRKRPELHLQLDILWNFFGTLNKDEYDLFIASDTDSVKASAKERFPERMINTAGNITHIDQPGIHDPREGFLKQLLDYYIMVDCDILIISSSGFGMLTAFVRNQDYGLYCWGVKGLLPCSRYTVNDIFPGGKFTPK
ncbi:uncharacterized protein LOC110452660 [Mizuhopecten yessoensis]|uniref:L-Fucosyltransferase n=1 Tax=Mizuhopecten yessoensis TaxID=6573 RepID=A0A210QJL1_MIZYE|nr:uncharacterized protein LOC110452660 [Mizuhopecten yessoensis]OWF48781.1 hypothetical protein KP79_PYT11998 [Mizuhopecten yessoensis]